MTIDPDQFDDEEKGFEERADFVADDVLRNGTALGDFFDDVHRSLVAKGLTLIVGPRGCGKTHMMRYTWLECCEREELPFCIYVSFNRYLRLEPLLQSRPDAIILFQSWVLGLIILACDESSNRTVSKKNSKKLASDVIGLKKKHLISLVSKLERGVILNEDEEGIVEILSIESVVSAVGKCSRGAGRKRSVILLDDAALTLTPEYLAEFFDIVRVLKRGDVSPKASVYPGSTEYGPRFHSTHEGRIMSVWLSPEQTAYSAVMQSIAERRYPEGLQTPEEIQKLLQYAAFGVPRAYLTMLRDYVVGDFATEQQGVNRVIQQHSEARLEEFRSIALKMPRFGTLIKTGEALFKQSVSDLRNENDKIANTPEKQTLLGLPSNMRPMPSRMVNLLIEAGLFLAIMHLPNHAI